MIKFILILSVFISNSVVAESKPKTLTIGMSSEYETLNPLLIHAQISIYLYLFTGRPLTMIDPSGQWVPKLAERIPTLKNGDAKIISKNGKKVLQVLWRIQENAKWSDGLPVVCDDFKLAR